MAKSSGSTTDSERASVRQIVLPVKDELHERLDKIELPTYFLLIDAESRFDARTLEPLLTLDSRVIVPVDLDSYGYELGEQASAYFETRFEDVPAANPIGAILIAADVLRDLLSESKLFAKRISEDDLGFQELLELFIDFGAEIMLADVFPIRWKRPVSKRSFRLRRASRPNDGFFSTVAVRPVSRQLSGLLAQTSISPNAVTTISFTASSLAAALFGTATRPLALLAVVLMYSSLVLDCVDGELARLTDRGSRFGAWLDGFTDRIKEHLLLVGLAVGSHRVADSAWLITTLAILVITLRHLSHFAFIETILKDFAPKDSRKRGRLFDRPGISALRWRQWVSRILHAPVSERWLIIGIGVVVFDQVTSLWLYGAYVLLSLMLVTIGWIRRTFAMTGALSGTAKLRVRQLAGGPVPKRMVQGAAGWLTVPLTMALESASILALFFIFDGTSNAWWPLAAMVIVSWLRYEDMYANLGPETPLWSGTWLSRTAIWLVAFGLGLAGLENVATWWLCGWVSALTALMLTNAAWTGHRLKSLSQTARGSGVEE